MKLSRHFCQGKDYLARVCSAGMKLSRNPLQRHNLVAPPHDADSWLAGRLGDVYPHETVISHIRRSLESRFPRSNPGETRARFANRMAKVQAYMNSDEFKACDGGGLASLAQSLKQRCRLVSELQGERLRT